MRNLDPIQVYDESIGARSNAIPKYTEQYPSRSVRNRRERQIYGKDFVPVSEEEQGINEEIANTHANDINAMSPEASLYFGTLLDDVLMSYRQFQSEAPRTLRDLTTNKYQDLWIPQLWNQVSEHFSDPSSLTVDTEAGFNYGNNLGGEPEANFIYGIPFHQIMPMDNAYGKLPVDELYGGYMMHVHPSSAVRGEDNDRLTDSTGTIEVEPKYPLFSKADMRGAKKLGHKSQWVLQYDRHSSNPEGVYTAAQSVAPHTVGDVVLTEGQATNPAKFYGYGADEIRHRLNPQYRLRGLGKSEVPPSHTENSDLTMTRIPKWDDILETPFGRQYLTPKAPEDERSWYEKYVMNLDAKPLRNNAGDYYGMDYQPFDAEQSFGDMSAEDKLRFIIERTGVPARLRYNYFMEHGRFK